MVSWWLMGIPAVVAGACAWIRVAASKTTAIARTQFFRNIYYFLPARL
jgi:hypothetical protein